MKKEIKKVLEVASTDMMVKRGSLFMFGEAEMPKEMREELKNFKDLKVEE